MIKVPSSPAGSARRKTFRSSVTIGASLTCTAKTDAATVFGAIYAQAEDDFNRIETNYLTSLGRLAEAEGESKICRIFGRGCSPRFR